VIDLLVRVMRMKIVVRGHGVGIDRRTGFNVLENMVFQVPLLCADHGLGNDPALALQKSHDNRFPAGARDIRAFPSLAVVHKLVFATYERFIDFYFAREFVERTVLQSQADSMQHEPSSLLGDAKSAGQLARTDAVLGIDNHPDSRKPLVEAKGRLLKDRALLNRELTTAALTEPTTARSHEGDIGSIASRATHLAVRPVDRGHEGQRPVRVSKIR
jgi:hypothetical protein